MASPKLQFRSEVATAWLFCDAQKEEGLVRYFLKALVDSPGERHGNLRLALSHTRVLACHLEGLIAAEEGTKLVAGDA